MHYLVPVRGPGYLLYSSGQVTAGHHLYCNYRKGGPEYMYLHLQHIEEDRVHCVVVLGSYQNYQNGAVSNQLTDVGRIDSVLGMMVNLLLCDRGNAMYCTLCSLQYIVSLHKHVTPKNGKYKYEINFMY